jgi:hypothetical protein
VLIALLAAPGVDLSVIVALMAVVLARKRWVSRQPGAFSGAIRVIEGEVPGLTANGSAATAAGSATFSSGRTSPFFSGTRQYSQTASRARFVLPGPAR